MRLTRKKQNTMRKQRGGANPYIIGVCGGSGSGKSTISKNIKALLISKGIAENDIVIISTDNYFHAVPPPEVIAPEDFNGDLPEGCDLPFLLQNIKDIISKKGNVAIPKYDMETNKRSDEPAFVVDTSSVKYVIVEGIFAFHIKEMRNLFNFKIFVELDTDICLGRRMLRDKAEHGISEAHTMKSWQRFVKPSYLFYIEPTRVYADIIINTSELSNNDKSMAMVVQQILGCP